jgi:hypothetical protein
MEGEAAARFAVQIFPRFALISLSPSLQTQTTKMGAIASYGGHTRSRRDARVIKVRVW